MTILQSAIAQAAAGGGYQIARSLRFNQPDSAYLNRTLTTPTSRRIYTSSSWIKRSGLGVTAFLSAVGPNPGTWDAIRFDTNDTLSIRFSADTYALSTTQVFRDVSSWYHIVIAVDTTQATSSNRVKVYVNGVQVTAFSGSYPVQNLDTAQLSGNLTRIGSSSWGTTEIFPGYMAETYFIDGQALDPTSFGETDSATGVWMPKQVTGMTYGTNGFYVNFSDNSNTTAATLGKDYSPNGNNWTPNNFSVTAGVGNDSLVDSPTNYGTDTGAGGEVRGNYATWNALDNNTTLSNGNLAVSAGSSQGVTSTFALPSGSWYWENIITTVASNTLFGVIAVAQASTIRTLATAGIRLMAQANGTILLDGTSPQTGLTSWANGDVIACAFNASTNSMQFYRNGSTYGTAVTATSGYVYVPFGGSTANTSVFDSNFGQRAFAYTAPSGFKALCTQNLSTPAIGATSSTLASKNFDATLYTGTGSSLSVSNASSFRPDLVWLKSRSNAQDHKFTDIVRGVTKAIISNSSGTETTDTNGLTAFNSTGFTVGSDSNYNTNAATYVGWQWKGGGTGVSNTSGSITSTVSANPTAGFSAVTYTGNGSSGATFGHGLGVVPRMIIFKCRDTAYDWLTYHVKLGNTAFVALNTFSAQTTGRGDFLNSTTPSSSLVTLGNTAGINESTKTYVAYCFAEVAGFSKFDSYVGNSSTDGPFIYCGFRPRFLVIKSLASAGWYMVDAARNTYNVMNGLIYPNFSNAEGSGVAIDFLSNGFKLRGTQSEVNAGDTYIYMAFAESPFNYARAR